jgi:monovalent cation:H+ antiporter-2, CPA2 family
VGHVDSFYELVLILAAGVAAAVGVALLRLPAVAGFMLAGAVVGPFGFGLVKEQELVDTLSEIGVVLLLFTIGLEFSLERLRRIWKLVAIGGTLQVGLTTLACVGVALGLGETIERGVFFGFLVALSSTAIVLRGLSERGEVDAPHAKFTIGALIYQDLCVIPMMLLVPILAGRGEGSAVVGIGVALAKATVFVVATLVAGRFLVPRALARVDAARSREVFLLAVLVFCASVALLTAYFGLSLALGAFLAGILLSDSAYGHRAMANVLPLRDVLTSLFFMSLGMLFDVSVVRDQPVLVALLFAGIFFGKGFIATLASVVMRFPARVAWLAGVGLAQFGEFGFVLAKEGMRSGILTSDESRLVLAAGILTMFVTPLSMRLAPHVTAGAALLRPLERLLGVRGIDERAPEHATMKDHVIVAGYGIGGRLLSAALHEAHIPFLVIELNSESVREGRAGGMPIYYADVTSEEALTHAHLTDAHALVLLISDSDAARQALAVARQLAPDVPIIVRARRVSEEAHLRLLGASDVIMEELEAGIEVLARVLRSKGTPVNVVGGFISRVRDELGRSVRSASLPRSRVADLKGLDELKVESMLIAEGSPAAGKTLAELDVRARTGASVLAIRRDGALLERLDAQTEMRVGDVLFLAGPRESIFQAVSLLDGRSPGSVARA